MSASGKVTTRTSAAGARPSPALNGREALEAGVSILLCTHNGRSRLEQPLEHLRRQREVERINWEIVLVDNASTDGTAEFARKCWEQDNPAPLRIISEPRLGVSLARQAGFDAVRYEYISVIDDDNLVCDRWIARVVEVMTEHPEVGACGGYSEAVCEGRAPRWLQRFGQFYAIGPQQPQPGMLLETLWFAGMTVRAQAWRDLRRGGFRFLTVNGAEDNEFSLALRLAGWKLWLDDDLRLAHVLPANRLTWPYFCTLQRSRFASLVAVDPYRFALDHAGGYMAKSWGYQFAIALRALLQNLIVRPRKVLWPHDPAFEGDDDVFRIELSRGRLAGLLKHRRDYAANVRAIANAAWRDGSPAMRT